MADQFVAEIRIVPFNFAPNGWAFCDGQILQISQNTALFSLLGTTYGGDGRSTFALPNLQGLVPIHFGQSSVGTQFALGQTGGSEAITLLQSQMPSHAHGAPRGFAGAPAGTTDPTNAAWSRPQSGRQPLAAYANAAGSAAPMSAQALSVVGGSLPHNNLQPYLVLNFIIALQGIFPARS